MFDHVQLSAQFNRLTIDTKEVDLALSENTGQSGKDYYVLFPIQYAIRRALPYGKWTCDNGREVVFNREYQPIFERTNGVCAYAKGDEWVEDITQTEYYYDDSCDPVDHILSRLIGLGNWNFPSNVFGDENNPKAFPDIGETISAEVSPHEAFQKKQGERTMAICIEVLGEFTPKESPSTSGAWSARMLCL